MGKRSPHPRLLALLLPLLLALLLFGQGCGVVRIAARSATTPLVEGGMEAMMAESDLPIARDALASNLILMEGMLRSDPGNKRLLLRASQGFFAYSLAFADGVDSERARELYLRSRDYANRWLASEHGVNLLETKPLDAFQERLEELPEKALPGVFWLGNAWASALMLSLTDMQAIAELPKTEALMRWVLEHDEGYFFASAHLFFGGYYGARSTFLGGDPDKARNHLERQIALTEGQVLLGHLFMVRYVHLPALDGEAAEQALREILAFEINEAPENTRLINRVAQEKARRLLANLDDYL